MNVLILVALWSKLCIVLYCLKIVIIVLNGASELFVFLPFLGVVQWLAVSSLILLMCLTAGLPSVFGPHTVDFGSNNQTLISVIGNIRITLWGQLNGIFEIFYKNFYQKIKIRICKR